MCQYGQSIYIKACWCVCVCCFCLCLLVFACLWVFLGVFGDFGYFLLFLVVFGCFWVYLGVLVVFLGVFGVNRCFFGGLKNKNRDNSVNFQDRK